MRHASFISILAIVVLTGFALPAQGEQVVYYSFDNVEGDTVEDQSRAGNDGSLEDAPVVIDGQYEQALAFDNSRVVIPVSDSLTADLFQESFTLVAWINPTRTGNAWQQIFRAITSGATNDTLFLNNNGTLSWRGTVGGAWAGGMCETAADAVPADQWTHAAVVGDGANFRIYLNGELSVESAFQTTDGANTTYYVGGTAGGESYNGAVDEFSIFTEALSQGEIQSAMAGLGNEELAYNPNPGKEAVDVLRDTPLSWAPGAYAATHDVYVGTSFEDVNSAAVPTAGGLDVNSFDPGRLDFDQTYFWRVDEVNGAPDNTVFKGNIWSFTVEPYSIQIPGDTITVTASSESNEFSTAVKTIDGSGLDAEGQHSIAPETMWFTESVDLDPWIQYEFDDVQKLDTMKVWNSNSSAEIAIGWGVKDVEIVYSVDGENWTVLEGATQFSRGPGSPTYDQYDEIAFDGAAAKYVRFNIISNWGGILMSYSLSEVQFSMIPVKARTPEPDSGSVDVVPNAVVTWRAGREADQHVIYIGTDPNEVADGLAPSVTTSTNSLDLSSVDLELGEIYYWRVDEVNEAEAVSVWAGPVWSLTTVGALVVDDFESYNNISPDRPFQTWLDGFGYSADEYFPNGYEGNGTGAGIGHDIWALSSPHYDGDIMETSNTISGSGQSMPLYYTNSGGTASETQRVFDVPQDWTVGAVKTLSIAFFGQSGNTGQLYVKINGAKVTYDMEAEDIALAAWQAWNIDLASLSVNLQSVTEMAIGVEGNGAEGMVLIDDIRLYAEAGELITPVDPGTDGLVSVYHLDGDFSDSAGGHNGTAIGNPVFVSDADQGQVVSLDGASSGADIPYSAALNPAVFSASLWVNADPIGTGHRSPLTSRDDGPAKGYIIYAEPGNTWQFWIGTGTGWSATQGAAVALGEWTHLAISYADEANRLYVNGILAGESTNAIEVNAQQPLRIGGGATEGPGNYFFVGMIDEVRIYDTELTEGEVLWLSGRDTPAHKPF